MRDARNEVRPGIPRANGGPTERACGREEHADVEDEPREPQLGPRLEIGVVDELASLVQLVGAQVDARRPQEEFVRGAGERPVAQAKPRTLADRRPCRLPQL